MISKNYYIFSLEIEFVLVNSANPDKICCILSGSTLFAIVFV